ncbi:MAG TPA: helix-hairpin-helix domain-containing protein [Usitatibacter sp.]|nr:helix-hairpin-helix domain-containing protein [Usitatibacter sp.]
MKRIFAAIALVPMGIGAAFALVNVNTAQQSDLQRTKGLDRYKAKSIIEYRAQSGIVFTSLEDLEKVPGLDKATVEKIAPQVAFDGPPYTPPKPEPKKGKEKATVAAR